MSVEHCVYSVPKNRILRWLVDAGPDVPTHIRNVLLGEMFAAPRAVLAGMINGLIVNFVALHLNGGRIFLAFMLLDILLVTVRMWLAQTAVNAARRGAVTPTGAYLVCALGWCGLQGVMAFTAMQTGNHTLQLLSGVSVMGVVGPACARNYAAPRYAMVLIALLVVPFVAGAAPFRDPWMLILIVQSPLFLFGSLHILQRFQTLSVAALQAQYDSQHRARHDSLTGLLNRFGLGEALEQQFAAGRPLTLFYLDLDGFKPVNDTFGHQAGDQLLAAVAGRLREAVRDTDLVARLGGDEFVVAAADLRASVADTLAASLVHRIGDEPYYLDATRKVTIGVSIGFACTPADAANLAELHRKADAALYEAKGAGRGTYRRFIDPNAAPVLRMGVKVGWTSPALATGRV